MRIKCKYNEIGNTGSLGDYNKSYLPRDGKFFLQKNKEYLVYAILIKNKELWFFVLDETNNIYPNRYPSPLFEIVDRRVSRFWSFTNRKSGLLSNETLIAIPEWVEDQYFYDSLTDGVSSAKEKFLEYVTLMELEFPISSNSLKAKSIDKNWFECPSCDEIFENTINSAMLKCPNCQIISHNPNY